MALTMPAKTWEKGGSGNASTTSSTNNFFNFSKDSPFYEVSMKLAEEKAAKQTEEDNRKKYEEDEKRAKYYADNIESFTKTYNDIANYSSNYFDEWRSENDSKHIKGLYTSLNDHFTKLRDSITDNSYLKDNLSEDEYIRLERDVNAIGKSIEDTMAGIKSASDVYAQYGSADDYDKHVRLSGMSAEKQTKAEEEANNALPEFDRLAFENSLLSTQNNTVKTPARKPSDPISPLMQNVMGGVETPIEIPNAHDDRDKLMNAQAAFGKYVEEKEQEGKTIPSVKEEDKPKATFGENALGFAQTASTNLALGAANSISSIVNGLEQAIGDAASGGAYSDGFKVLSDYFGAMPSELRTEVLAELGTEGHPNRPTRIGSVSRATGVSQNVIEQYAKSVQNENMRESVLNSGYAEKMNPTLKENTANIAFSIGQQIPGLMLSGALSGATSATSAIGSAIGANPSTVLIGMSVAGNEAFNLAREKGYNPSIYAEAVMQGGIEMMLEGLIGFSDVASYQKLMANTGSTVGNVAKSFIKYIVSGAEEGLEEVINVPLSNLTSMMFGSEKKVGFGEGDVFDYKAMIESGMTGSAVGLIMGGVMGTSMAVSAVKEGADIRYNADWLNKMAQKLPEHYRPAVINATKATEADVENYGKELIGAFNKYMADSKSGDAVLSNKDKYGEDVASVTEDNSTVQLADQAEVLAHVQAEDTEGAKEIIEKKIQHYNEMAEALADDESLKEISGEGTSEKIASNVARLTETKDMLDAGTYNADEAQKAISVQMQKKIAEGKKTTAAARQFAETVKRNLGVVQGERAIAHTVELLENDVKNGVSGASAQLKVAKKALDTIRREPSAAVRSLLGANEKTLGEAISDTATKRTVQLDYSMPEGSFASYNRGTGTVKINPVAVLRAQQQMDSGNKARSEFVHEAGHIAAQMDASFVSKVYDVYEQLRDSGIIPQFGEGGINENEIREAYRKDRSLTNYLNTATVKAGVKQLMDQGATLEQAQSGFVDAFLKEEVAMHFLSYAENHGANLFNTIAPEKRNAFVEAMRKIAQFFRDVAAKIRGNDPASAKKMDTLADKLYNAVRDFAGGSTTAQESVNAKTTENTTATESVVPEGSTGTRGGATLPTAKEIFESLDKNGEFNGYKVTDKHYSTVDDSASFVLVKPNGEKVEGRASWNPAGNGNVVAEEAARMILKDLEDNADKTGTQEADERKSLDVNSMSEESRDNIGEQVLDSEAAESMTNEEAFEDSEVAVRYSIRPPYSDGSKAFNEFAESLSPEARKTFDMFYGFYQRSRITNALSVSGKRVKGVNISSLYLRAQEWNDMLRADEKWRTAAQDLADFLPKEVRERMRMNPDGTLNPNPLEEEFKMPSSLAQRLVDSLPYEMIDAEYKLGGKTITLPEGKARQSVGGEAYRRAIIDETRKLYESGKLKQVGIGTMSKDRWGSLGFLAANGKTGASGDFTTVCPQMMFNRGCWYCYRRAAMEKGVNNKLVANNVWYTGEILRIKDSDIKQLNENGGLRIQSFGDWMPHFSAMFADVLYDAEMRGLQVKIITKEPSMINYIAAIREQGVGKNLYFNLSADYTIEKATPGNGELDAVNPERPFQKDDEGFWWKRAMTVEEAAKYRDKYPWVNTRIVATDVNEFIRGLKDSRVDVVTGYHGNIREFERVDSTTGEHKVMVEALGDAGMPRFAFNPATNEWVTEYEGKTQTHKRLAEAIASEGLQMEYYTKTCCITGRCASCKGKCGALARDFNVKNATNRDEESVAYWRKEMQYAIEPEFGDMTESETRFSLNVVPPVKSSDTKSWRPGHAEDWFNEHGLTVREDVSEAWLEARKKKGWKEGKKPLREKGFDGESKKVGTQISTTEITYARIFDYLKNEYPDTWQDMRILDASSGLGLGTKTGLEAGFDVTDIEPYVHPDSDYFPDYMDYSSLERLVLSGEVEPFDFIISNAVLNVIPQDTRDNMVAWFDNVLAPGGQLYVNTLGANYTKDVTDEVATYKNGKVTNKVLTDAGDYTDKNHIIGNEVYVGGSQSVQKGFSPDELKAYLRDALGDGYTVETPKFKAGSGAVAIATKNADNFDTDERKSIATGTSIYIKDGHTADGETVDFINLILDGKKKGETRTHKSLTRKWVGIAKDGYVYGRVRFGEPYLIDKDSPEYADSYIEGTEYDIADGEQKYYYPILEVEDFRDAPKPITKHGNYAQYEDVDEDVRYSLPSIEKITPSADQMSENAVEVARMNPVYVVPAQKLAKSNDDLKDVYGSYFTSWGENIHSEVFGDVALKKSSIRSEIRHGTTSEKIASIGAIPAVIEYGKIVDWIEKNPGVYRVVVAAPIQIGDVPYYMGVMLQRDSQNQRLYIHDVEIEKETSSTMGDDLLTTGSHHENDSLFMTSILQKAIDVKRKLRNSNMESASDSAYMSAIERGDMDEAQRMVDEAAKKAGYTVKAYHGTPSFGFTVFDPKKSDDKTTLFFTESVDIAKTYAGRDIRGTKDIKDAKSFEYERGRKYSEEELKAAHDFIQKHYHVYGTTRINVDKQTVTHAGTRYSAKQIMEMADSIAKKGIYGVYLDTNGFLVVDADGSSWSNMDAPDDFYDVTDNTLWKEKVPFVGTRDYARYAKMKGYRGITFKNLRDFGNRNEPVSHRLIKDGTDLSTIHVLFDSSQVKSADPVTYDGNGNVIPLSERFNPLNDDIRYSKETTDKRIARLKEDKEFLKQQMEKSRSVALSPADVDKIVKEMRDQFGFDNSERDNIKKMLKLIDDVVNKKIKPERMDEVWDSLARGARSILEGVYEVDASLMKENEAFIKHIRSTPLSVLEENENDFAGGYAEYRNENRKYVNLSKNGTPVETVYAAICEQYPGILDPTVTNPAYMIDEIVHAMKALEPVDAPSYADTIDQAAREFAHVLGVKYMNTARKTHFSDTHDEIEKLKHENKQTVTAYEARLRSIESAAARDAEEYERIINRYKNIEEAREFAGDRKEYARRIRQDARALRSAAVSPNSKKFVPEKYRKNVENIALWLDRVSVGGVNLNSDDAKWTAIAYIRDDINKVSAMFSEDFLGLANGLLNQIEDITGEAGRAYNKDLKAAIFYRDAYKLGRLMRKSIADMNKVVIGGKNVNASIIGGEITDTLDRRERAQKTFESLADKKKGGKLMNIVFNKNLSFTDARSFFHRMGKAGDNIYETLREAQSRQYLYMKQYTDKVNEALSEEDLSRYAGEKQKVVSITLSNGKEYTLTAAQAMNIVTLYERSAGKSHIEKGGVRIYDPKTRQVSKATALTEKDIASLRNALDDTDKKVMRVLADFMRDECTAWGNEATMEKYGFHRFTTRDYFPISVDRTSIGADMKTYAPAQFNVENVGFAKTSKDDGSAPVLIDSMIDVANNHIRGMATYAAYLNVEDGINRILKVPGVVDAMKRALGSDAEKYITEMMNDLKGAGKTESLADNTVSYLNKLAGRYKAAAVSYNASTVAKQPLSYLRAAAVIDPKYLVKGATGNHKTALDEMMKHSGIAVRKEIGYSDVGVGKTIGEQIGYTERGTLKSGVRKFNEFGMAGAALADRVTWESIWLACKAEQAEKNAGAAVDRDALMKATAKRFADVVAQTQVVDSALDSAPVSRSNNPLVRFTYAFMSEPVKGYNLLVNALDDLVNSPDKNAKSRAAKHLARVSAYTILGWAAEAAITSAFSAIRDDDDEILDKFSETYFGNLGQNALGILPMADPIVDAFLEVFQGYTPSNMADQTLIDVASGMVDAFKTIMDAEGKRETPVKAIRDAVESVATMLGVPVKNIVRMVNNTAKSAFQITNAYKASYELQKIWYNPNNATAREKNGFNSILADAYLSGDREAFEYIYEDMRKMGLKPQQIVNSIAKDSYEDDIADKDKSTLVKYTPGSDAWYIGMKTIFNRDEKAPKATEDEITRVYKASGETSVLPKFKDGKYTVDGTTKEFEGDALDKYLEDYGNLYYEVANAMRDLAAYRKGSAEEQAWWLTKAEKFASAAAIYTQDKDYSVTSVGKWVSDYVSKKPYEVAKYIVGNLEKK